MSIKLLKPEDFKKLAKDGKPEDVGVRKYVTLQEVKEVKGEGEEGEVVVDFIISTDGVDRDSDTVAVDGWNLSNYRKNPVVLFGHDYHNPPVARAPSVFVENGALQSRAHFTSKDLYPFGHMIGQMYLNKFMNAVSVGFLPEKYEFDESRKYGVNFKEQELLEYSAVPVPSNPEALMQARSFGIDTAPMVEWAEKILDGEDGDDVTIFIPKKALEGIRTAAGAEGKTFDLGLFGLSESSQDDPESKDAGGDTSADDPTDKGASDEVVDGIDKESDQETAGNKGTGGGNSNLSDTDKGADWETVSAGMVTLLGGDDEKAVLEADRQKRYEQLKEQFAAHSKVAPDFRFIKGQVLLTLPESFNYDLESGVLREVTADEKKEIARLAATEKAKDLFSRVKAIVDEVKEMLPEQADGLDQALKDFESCLDKGGDQGETFIEFDDDISSHGNDKGADEVLEIDDVEDVAQLRNVIEETTKSSFDEQTGKLN